MDTLSATALAKGVGIDEGAMLVTRHYGRLFLAALDAALHVRPEEPVVALDFLGVSVMDGSFADEAFGVFASRGSRRDWHGYLLLQMLPEHVEETLEITMRSRPDREPGVRNCVLPIERSGRVELLGKAEPHVRESFELLRTRRHLTARDVAKALHLDIHAASTRLKTLHVLGLASRVEEKDGPGRQYLYGWPF